MTHNSSVLFCLKHEILWTKVHIKMQILKLATARIKIYQVPQITSEP